VPGEFATEGLALAAFASIRDEAKNSLAADVIGFADADTEALSREDDRVAAEFDARRGR
jgi:hypothetical protein